MRKRHSHASYLPLVDTGDAVVSESDTTRTSDVMVEFAVST